MTEYQIIWMIDVEADSPEAAAKEALLIQRDSGSEATFFTAINQETNEKFDLDGSEY